MATAAQIAANRRNAGKSTGPKSSRGKKASSRNAVRHGMTAAISTDDIRRFAEIISAEFPAKGSVESDPRHALLLLQLAEAEARLERVRKAERETLARGDADLRLGKAIKGIVDVLVEDREFWKRLTPEETFDGLYLMMRAAKAGQANARRTYASLRRYLREAEIEQAAALRDWLSAN